MQIIKQKKEESDSYGQLRAAACAACGAAAATDIANPPAIIADIIANIFFIGIVRTGRYITSTQHCL